MSPTIESRLALDAVSSCPLRLKGDSPLIWQSLLTKFSCVASCSTPGVFMERFVLRDDMVFDFASRGFRDDPKFLLGVVAAPCKDRTHYHVKKQQGWEENKLPRSRSNSKRTKSYCIENHQLDQSYRKTYYSDGAKLYITRIREEHCMCWWKTWNLDKKMSHLTSKLLKKTWGQNRTC